MPMMAFIGVRISWLMLARKSLFAWVAASAACLAWSDGFLGALPGRDVADIGEGDMLAFHLQHHQHDFAGERLAAVPFAIAASRS